MSTMLTPTMLSGKQHPMSVPWMPDMEVEHIFISRARSFLDGDSPGKGLQANITPGLPLEEIEQVLQQLVTKGNSALPVADACNNVPQTSPH